MARPSPPRAAHRPLELPHPWIALVEAFGTLGDLAESVGVTTRTVRRWAQGEVTIGGPAVRAIRKVARDRNVPSPI
jgi:predicted transcriptional regulator